MTQDEYARKLEELDHLLNPSGQQSARTMIQIFRLANGKIAEEWNEGESLLG